MRLWHYKLIQVLSRQQLLGQWRECCLITKNLYEKGTPNHILVNKVTDYPIDEFRGYCRKIYDEMCARGYSVAPKDFLGGPCFKIELFPGWHTDDYLRQCYYNLQEKHDCGGITDEEWSKIEEVYHGSFGF